MRSTISIKLLLIICACWTTTTLAIELPSHENQQLRLEDAKPIIVLPWEVIDELQLSQRRPKSPPPPRRSPSPPPPRRSPPPPPPRSPPPPPPPPMRSPPPPAPLAPPPSWESPPPTPMASPPPPTPLAPPPPKIIYPIVTFDLLGANSITYNQFVFDLRENLRSPDNLAYFGIPMIRNPCTIFDFNRFLLVQLIGLKHSTTLALRVRDGSLVGYCRSHDPTTAWFFDDTTEDEKALLFQDEDVEHQSLGFEGNYDSLGGRNDVLINPAVIDFSITTLSRTKSEEDMTEVKRSLLIITQVVSEAARFQYIAGPVAKTMDSFFYQYVLDARARSYQDNWITLSEEVANSIGLGGAFRNPVVLADENGLVIEYIGFVWQIVNDMSLLAFVAT